jgi:hypothetical protein
MGKVYKILKIKKTAAIIIIPFKSSEKLSTFVR